MRAVDQADPLKIAVLLPTTAEILTIAKLSPLPNVPRSNATLVNDFRPIQGVAASYHGLVNGPLANHLALSGQWLLEITGSIEKGRSWELPALMAHLVVKFGAQLTPNLSDADHIIWSTGAIDSALAPIVDDYSLAAKAALSDAFLESARESGVPVHVMTAALSQEDRAAMETIGADSSRLEAKSLSDVESWMAREIFNDQTETVAASTLLPIEKRRTDDHDSGVIPATTAFAPDTKHKKSKKLIPAAMAIAAITGIFAFGASNGFFNTSTGSQKKLAPMISIVQNHARDRKACIDKIVSGQNFNRTIATLAEDQYALSGDAHTCAVDFINTGNEAISIRLDTSLADFVMPGDNPIRRAITLRAGDGYRLPFRSAPYGVKARAILSNEDTEETLHLTFKNEGIE